MVRDDSRNWTPDATTTLINSWKCVANEGRAPDEKGSHVNERIYRAYRSRIPTTRRTFKAIEDKMGEKPDVQPINASASLPLVIRGSRLVNLAASSRKATPAGSARRGRTLLLT